MPENPVLRVLRRSVGCAVLVAPVLSQWLKLPNLCVSFWIGWKNTVSDHKSYCRSLLAVVRRRNCLSPAKHKIFLEFGAGVLTLHFLLSENSTHHQPVFVFFSVVAAFQCCAVFLICIFKCTVLCKEMKEHLQCFFSQP